MKKTVSLLAPLFACLWASAARAVQPPIYLYPERHWFQPGVASTNSDSGPQQETMPIVIHWDDSPSNNLTNAQAVAAVQAAIQQWTSVACTQLSYDATETPASSNHISFEQGIDVSPNGPSRVTFDDPGDDLAPLVLAATLVEQDPVTPAQTVNGQQFLRIPAFQIMFAKGWQWVTRAQDQAGDCLNQEDIQSVAVHELGHGLGYAHSCESGESCTDPEMRGSIMYWRQGFCETLQPNAYDTNQDVLAYGFGRLPDFTSTARSGRPPLSVDFTALPQAVGSTAATIQSASWQFGDGATSVALNPSHTYEAEGQYPVNLEMTMSSPACGPAPFTRLVTRQNYVTACNPLVPAFTSMRSGNSVQFMNQTPGAASDCLNSLVWDFGDGTLGFTEQPVHVYAKAGTYQVSLTASGPAGTAAPVFASVNVGGGVGCSVDGVPEAGLGRTVLAVLLGALVVLYRRRAA